MIPRYWDHVHGPWVNFDIDSDVTDTTVVDQPINPGRATPKTGSGTEPHIKYNEVTCSKKCSMNQSSTIHWMDVHGSEDIVKTFTVPDIGPSGPGPTVVPTQESFRACYSITDQRDPNAIVAVDQIYKSLITRASVPMAILHGCEGRNMTHYAENKEVLPSNAASFLAYFIS
ncbi:hypothetical protein EV424DRAFT_1048492 [Suillus variegatus]|nr:hypothetical protein EV424DRAFT_1048492 [Suillus variegatus]